MLIVVAASDEEHDDAVMRWKMVPIHLLPIPMGALLCLPQYRDSREECVLMKMANRQRGPWHLLYSCVVLALGLTKMLLAQHGHGHDHRFTTFLVQ